MDARRILRHLAFPELRVRRAFPPQTLAAIERAIHECEASHLGEIRFVVEGAIHPMPLLRGVTPRERARQVFSDLRVWDTEKNTGVLVYLLLADRHIEIVADRGIHARVGDDGWLAICRDMEAALRAGRVTEGVVTGIRAIGALLTEHFPSAGEPNPNELPDRPVLV